MLVPSNWQTPAAIAVVALTLLIFAVQIARRKKRGGGGCGGGCDCPASKKPPAKPGAAGRLR